MTQIEAEECTLKLMNNHRGITPEESNQWAAFFLEHDYEAAKRTILAFSTSKGGLDGQAFADCLNREAGRIVPPGPQQTAEREYLRHCDSEDELIASLSDDDLEPLAELVIGTMKVEEELKAFYRKKNPRKLRSIKTLICRRIRESQRAGVA